MQQNVINLQRAMAKAARDLHRLSDEIVTELEAHPDLHGLSDDNAEGDETRAALEGARRWRSLIESGAAD